MTLVLPPELVGMSAWLWLAGGLAFFLGGIVKGTLGVGLPLIVVPLLSLGLPTSLAISLMVVPVLASNAWQTYDSRASRGNMRRFAPLVISLMISMAATVSVTLALSASALNTMMAVAVLVAVTLMTVNSQFSLAGPKEKPVGVVVGALAGILGGVSSLTGPIIISYLMTLKLKREEFIGSVSVIYLFGAIPLYATLAFHGRLQWTHLVISTLAMAPIVMGMLIGKHLRGRIREEWFRRVLLLFLLGIALALVLK